MSLAAQVRAFLPAWVSGAVALSVVVFGSFAQAGIIYTGTYFDVQVSTPIDVGSTDTFQAVTLTAVGKNGYSPNAFDSSGSGIMTKANSTTVADLHQVYQHDDEGSKARTPTLSTAPGYFPLTTTQLSLDTHFLVYNDSIISYTTPYEDKDSLYTGEDPYGFRGISLIGAFSLIGDPPSQTWDFAYIVVFKGAQVQLNCQIGAALGSDSKFETMNVLFTVPEPGTLVMLCTGGVVLAVYLSRRRKS